MDDEPAERHVAHGGGEAVFRDAGRFEAFVADLRRRVQRRGDRAVIGSFSTPTITAIGGRMADEVSTSAAGSSTRPRGNRLDRSASQIAATTAGSV